MRNTDSNWEPENDAELKREDVEELNRGTACDVPPRVPTWPTLSSEKRVSFGEFETKVNVPCIRCSTLNPQYSVVTSSIDVSSTVT